MIICAQMLRQIPVLKLRCAFKYDASLLNALYALNHATYTRNANSKAA